MKSLTFLKSSLWIQLGTRFLIGLCIGVLFHYLLYRFSLPIKPFIYAAF